MKIYVNDQHQIVALRQRPEYDTENILTEHEVEEDFLAEYCDTVKCGFCYKVSEDETGVKTISVYPFKDYSLLESIQREHELTEKKIIEAAAPPEIMLAATFAAVTFTDEQALQVPTLYPIWSPDSVEYKKDERVRYMDVLYKVLLDHMSQSSWTPDAAPSLFVKVLIPDPEVIPNWEQPSAENAYKKGDKVKHKDKTWESLIDNNVWEPGVVGTESLWKEV